MAVQWCRVVTSSSIWAFVFPTHRFGFLTTPIDRVHSRTMFPYISTTGCWFDPIFMHIFFLWLRQHNFSHSILHQCGANSNQGVDGGPTVSWLPHLYGISFFSYKFGFGRGVSRKTMSHVGWLLIHTDLSSVRFLATPFHLWLQNDKHVLPNIYQGDL